MHTYTKKSSGVWDVGYYTQSAATVGGVSAQTSHWNSIRHVTDERIALRLVNFLNGGTSESHVSLVQFLDEVTK